MGFRTSMGICRNIFSGYDNESGVSALEFTIVLPLIILLITGLVQLGNAYHELQVLQEALRQGARVAADLSKPGGGVACATLKNAAKSSARSYLKQNGLDPNTGIVDPNKVPWTITPTTTSKIEGGVTVYMVELTGQKNSKVDRCLFCANGFLTRILPTAKSVFALRGTCS